MMDAESEIKKAKELSVDQVISLMEIYLSEWQHRDEMLWMQTFKLFYANLIIIVLPNIASFLEIDLPPINRNIFPIIGMIMAIVFYYVAIANRFRLRANSLIYENLMELLGDEKYKRISIKDREKMKGGHLFSLSVLIIIVTTMFLSLEAIAIVQLIYAS